MPTILLLLTVLFGVAYLASTSLGLPQVLGFPLAVRVAGAVLVVAGLGMAGWVFVYRSPASMAVSTYITFMKLFKRIPMAEPHGRTEPLVVEGPQKYVRNPLYFGIIVMTFGWALVESLTYVIVGAVLLLIWFWVILIPFEERELKVLFGEQYDKYAAKVPMLVPFTKRKR